MTSCRPSSVSAKLRVDGLHRAETFLEDVTACSFVDAMQNRPCHAVLVVVRGRSPILPIRKNQHGGHSRLIEGETSRRERAGSKAFAPSGDPRHRARRLPRDYEIRPAGRWLESSCRRQKCPKKRDRNRLSSLVTWTCTAMFHLREAAGGDDGSPVGVQHVKACRRPRPPHTSDRPVAQTEFRPGNVRFHFAWSLNRSIRDSCVPWGWATWVTASRPSSQRKSDAVGAVRSAIVFPSSTRRNWSRFDRRSRSRTVESSPALRSAGGTSVRRHKSRPESGSSATRLPRS